MRILVISHEYPPIGGGGANACMFLTQGYAQSGHNVTLVTAWYEGLKEHESIDGVEIYRIKSKRAHKEHCSFKEMLSFIFKALPLADRLERKNRYDVCQIFFGIPSGPVGYWLKKRYGLPYVIRFGGGDIPGFQDRFKTVYKLIGPFVKIIWNNAAALVANSEGLKHFAEKFYSKKEISVICNGVDTAKFTPADEKNCNGVINLLFVSRLIERKGLQFVIPELKSISEGTAKDIHLTVVGDGPYRAALEELTAGCNVSELVTFAGQKDKDELPAYYRSGDIFVFPSKREGMPNAVLEAMASGLAVVMTPCEGSSELIDNNGVVADFPQFIEKLCALVANEAAICAMGKSSRQRAVEEFSWERAVERYLLLFENMRLQHNTTSEEQTV